MGLDIRLPIGMLFCILGGLLAVFGMLSDQRLYQRSLGVNVNLWWGLVLLAFGVAMLMLARRGPPQADSSINRPPASGGRGGESESQAGENARPGH